MTKQTWWRVEIERCARIPSGFGVAYVDRERDAAVCYWLGINVIAMWCRRFYVYLKNPVFVMTGDEAYRLARLERRVNNLIGDGR